MLIRRRMTKREKERVARKYQKQYTGEFEVMDKRIKPDGSLGYYVIYHPDARLMVRFYP